MDIFDRILGHEIPKQFFRNFIANRDIMPHALLLTGPPGVGKFALAFNFVRSFNCLDDCKPRCECLHCHQMNLGTFSDVFVASPESEIKAEQMRSLVGDVIITPRVSTHRLVIIDNFERVNETAANIFLKTLEEPPKHLVFLLCTSKLEGLLPTIRSRCIPIEFRAGQPSEVANTIESLFPDEDESLIERASSTGCFGTAIREIHADIYASSKKKDVNEEEPFGRLLQSFVDQLLLINPGEFAFHLKGVMQTLIGAVEGRWRLKQQLPKGLDLSGLKHFLNGNRSNFEPVNYLTEEKEKAKKLGEYDKGRILLGDLTQELYSRLTKLPPEDGAMREKLLQYLSLTRRIGMDLDGNRNIELTFEKLLLGLPVPNMQ